MIQKFYEDLEPNEKVQLEPLSTPWKRLYDLILESWETFSFDRFSMEISMFLFNSDVEPIIVKSTEFDLAILSERFLFLPEPEKNIEIVKYKTLLSVSKFNIVNTGFFTNNKFWALMQYYWEFCTFTSSWNPLNYGGLVRQDFKKTAEVCEIFKAFPEYLSLTDSVNGDLWEDFKKCSVGSCLIS